MENQGNEVNEKSGEFLLAEMKKRLGGSPVQAHSISHLQSLTEMNRAI